MLVGCNTHQSRVKTLPVGELTDRQVYILSLALKGYTWGIEEWLAEVEYQRFLADLEVENSER